MAATTGGACRDPPLVETDSWDTTDSERKKNEKKLEESKEVEDDKSGTDEESGKDSTGEANEESEEDVESPDPPLVQKNSWDTTDSERKRNEKKLEESKEVEDDKSETDEESGTDGTGEANEESEEDVESGEDGDGGEDAERAEDEDAEKEVPPLERFYYVLKHIGEEVNGVEITEAHAKYFTTPGIKPWEMGEHWKAFLVPSADFDVYDNEAVGDKEEDKKVWPTATGTLDEMAEDWGEKCFPNVKDPKMFFKCAYMLMGMVANRRPGNGWFHKDYPAFTRGLWKTRAAAYLENFIVSMGYFYMEGQFGLPIKGKSAFLVYLKAMKADDATINGDGDKKPAAKIGNDEVEVEDQDDETKSPAAKIGNDAVEQDDATKKPTAKIGDDNVEQDEATKKTAAKVDNDDVDAKKQASERKDLERHLALTLGMTLEERDDKCRRFGEWFDFCEKTIPVVDENHEPTKWEFNRKRLLNKLVSGMRDEVSNKCKLGIFSNRGLIQYSKDPCMTNGKNGVCPYIRGHYLEAARKWDQATWWMRETENGQNFASKAEDVADEDNSLATMEWASWKRTNRSNGWLCNRTEALSLYNRRRNQYKEVRTEAREQTKRAQEQTLAIKKGSKKKAPSGTKGSAKKKAPAGTNKSVKRKGIANKKAPPGTNGTVERKRARNNKTTSK